MKPTAILRNEHRVIEQVLNCLEIMTNQATTARRLDGAAAHAAIDFLRHFADGCHHRKEEDGLFPAMEARGFSADRGPTAVMRQEHVLGRAAVQGMDQNLAGAAAGDRDALASFVRSARSYVELLRAHISKEENCLFPMAETVLTEQEQAGLLERFEQVEHDDVEAGAHERYLALADELAKKFGVPGVHLAECSACGSHRS